MQKDPPEFLRSDCCLSSRTTTSCCCSWRWHTARLDQTARDGGRPEHNVGSSDTKIRLGLGLRQDGLPIGAVDGALLEVARDARVVDLPVVSFQYLAHGPVAAQPLAPQEARRLVESSPGPDVDGPKHVVEPVGQRHGPRKRQVNDVGRVDPLQSHDDGSQVVLVTHHQQRLALPEGGGEHTVPVDAGTLQGALERFGPGNLVQHLWV